MRCISVFIALITVTYAVIAQEPHLKNIRQLTFGGDNAEAYFSPDGKYLSFQSNNPAWGLKCDQIFVMNIDSAANNPAGPAPTTTGATSGFASRGIDKGTKGFDAFVRIPLGAFLRRRASISEGSSTSNVAVK